MKQMKTILRIVIAIALCYLIWSFVLLEVDFRNWAAGQRLSFIFYAIVFSGAIFYYKFFIEDGNP